MHILCSLNGIFLNPLGDMFTWTMWIEHELHWFSNIVECERDCIWECLVCGWKVQGIPVHVGCWTLDKCTRMRKRRCRHGIAACNLCKEQHGESWELHKFHVAMPCLHTSMLLPTLRSSSFFGAGSRAALSCSHKVISLFNVFLKLTYGSATGVAIMWAVSNER